jgi:hypothetical protein
MIWVSNCLTLSVPDEGYDFERTWWRLWLWAYLMKVMTLSVPDEGYDFERTWWRLWLWAYLMKVMTLSVPDEGYSEMGHLHYLYLPFIKVLWVFNFIFLFSTIFYTGIYYHVSFIDEEKQEYLLFIKITYLHVSVLFCYSLANFIT